MLKTTIKSNINFPKISLLNDLVFSAKNIIIPDIVRGIDKGMAITGGKLPKNMSATVKRKGHSRPLIDSGTLRSSFFYKKRGKFSVLIGIKNIRSQIGAFLQEGIETRSGRKRYIFFGISKDASKKVMKYMENKIRELTRG